MREHATVGGGPAPDPGAAGLPELMVQVARGDQEAFAAVFDQVSGPVLGVVRSVVRDPAQSEEVTQEVMVDLWRSAARYRPDRGSVLNWALTLAHRRAVDRVRSEQASSDRARRVALLEHTPAYDEVTEEVENRLDRERVRRCLRGLTERQRQSVTLAYYRG